jgi:hypothetical protein
VTSIRSTRLSTPKAKWAGPLYFVEFGTIRICRTAAERMAAFLLDFAEG